MDNLFDNGSMTMKLQILNIHDLLGCVFLLSLVLLSHINFS